MGAYTNEDNSIKRLRKELREESLLAKYGEVRYNEIKSLFEHSRNLVLEKIREENEQNREVIINRLLNEKRTHYKLITSTQPPKKTSQFSTKCKRKRKHSDNGVDSADEKLYKEWAKNNTEPQIPVVSAQKLLLKLGALDQETDKNDPSELVRKCASQQTQEYNSFWDRSLPVLKALRSCLLTRNWDNMVRLLLILINKNHAKMYLPIIKSMCKVMIQFNPALQQSGVDKQLKVLITQASKKNVEDISDNKKATEFLQSES